MNDRAPRGLFEGVRILELGQYVAVPYCAELFAHGGADVIKIEPVTGDETRFNSPIIPGEGRQYIIKARGKRGLPVNLGTEAGRALARRIALGCDVVLSNIRPGGVEQLGLDYDALAAQNPRLVYGEINAFGRRGPEGDKPAIDPVVQAASGMIVAGRGSEDGRPVPNEAMLGDYMAGTLLAFGVTAALRERDRTGRGQKVSTTLMQAMLALQHASANVFHAVDGWKHELVEWIADARPPYAEAFARRRQSIATGHYWVNTYETADGYVTVGAPAQLRRRLAKVLGMDDPALSDPNWEMPDDPRPYMAAVTAQARARAKQFQTDDLVRALEAEGVPCSRVRFLEEVMLGEHAAANEFVYTADHPKVGPMTLPSAPVRFSEARYAAADDSPAYGEHTFELLRALGLDEKEIESLVASGVVGIEGGLQRRT